MAHFQFLLLWSKENKILDPNLRTQKESAVPNESGPKKPSENFKKAVPAKQDETVSNGATSSSDDDREDLVQEVHWLQHATFWSQVGLAVIGIAALCIYYCQLQQMVSATTAATNQSKVALDTFENTVRPYLGVNAIAGINMKPPHAPNLDFNAVFENYGSIPAEKVETSWQIFVGGVEQSVSKIPDQPKTLFPGDTTILAGQIGSTDFPDVKDGRRALVVIARYSYRWREKENRGCEKFQFYEKATAFMSLGLVCNP